MASCDVRPSPIFAAPKSIAAGDQLTTGLIALTDSHLQAAKDNQTTQSNRFIAKGMRPQNARGQARFGKEYRLSALKKVFSTREVTTLLQKR
jgi:hypothetical protein